MNKKDITCDLLRERYEALSEQKETCSRLLVTKGPLSTEFINAFRVFEERRKELKVLMKEYRWGWMEGLPILEITREHNSVDEYYMELHNKGYEIEGYADSLLDNITIRKTDEKHLTLIKVTPEVLGLTERSPHYEILEAAEKKGLKPCPAWVGPQYRLDCADDEETSIGMESVHGTPGSRGVLSVGRNNDSRWLGSFGARLHWGPDREYVFVIPEHRLPPGL